MFTELIYRENHYKLVMFQWQYGSIFDYKSTFIHSQLFLIEYPGNIF